MAARRTVLRSARLLQSRIRQEQLVPWLQKQTERQQLGGYQASDLLRPLECSTCVPCRGKKTAGSPPQETPAGSSTAKTLKKVLLPILGAGMALAAAPVAVAALGFGAGGIAAGSVAASMMSASATTGVGAGAVAVLQSVGAVGFSAAANVVLAGVGATAGGLLSKIGWRSKTGNNPPPEDKSSAGDGQNGNNQPPANKNRN